MFENETLEDDAIESLSDEDRGLVGLAMTSVAAVAESQSAGGHPTARSDSSDAKGSGEVSEASVTISEAQRSASTTSRYEKSPRVGAKGRVKRTEQQMIQSLGGSSVKEAVYVAERVRKLEDKISELMASVSQAAREHIIRDYPHLVRY